MTTALQRVALSLRFLGGRLRRDHVHAVVHAPGGAGTFGMVGATAPAAHFARVCFGAREGFTVRRGLHHSDWTRCARRLVRRHGFVVVSEVAIPAAMGPGLLRVPSFVALNVDLLGSETDYRDSLPFSARDDLRKIRKAGFTFEIAHDPSWAQEFFERFHRPAVSRRHGDEGYVMSPDLIAQTIREYSGEFVCASIDGRRVGALLAERQRGGYKFGRIGWLDGDPAWPKAGVNAALYWRGMQRARELGMRTVRLGGTPPYVGGGLFQFKMKWGAVLDPAECEWPAHHLLLNPTHPLTRRFFGEHALIAYDLDGRFVVLSGKTSGDVRLTHAMAASLSAWYRMLPEPQPVAAVPTDLDRLPTPLRAWFIREDLAGVLRRGVVS